MDFIPDTSVSLYFYSAIFQGNMALLGLVGVFVVFRLQTNFMQIRVIDEDFFAFVRAYISARPAMDCLTLDCVTVERLPEYLARVVAAEPEYSAKVRSEVSALLTNEEFARTVEKRKQRLAFRAEIKRLYKVPFRLTLAVVALSLVLIPLGPFVHQCSSLFEILLFSGVALLDLAALCFTLRFVSKALRHDSSISTQIKR